MVLEGDSRMYYYLTKCAHVSKGGLVLGNHEDPSKVVAMYCLDSIMTGKNRGIVDNYIFRPFGATSDVLKYFLASLLFWLDKFNTGLSWNNRVAQRMIGVEKNDINLKTLKESSASVNNDLNTMITHTTQSVDDVCKVLDILQDKLIDVSSKVDKANSRIAKMSTKMNAMSVLLHDIHSHIMGQATMNLKEKEPEEGVVTTASQDVPPASININKLAKDAMSVLMIGSKRTTNNTHFKDSL
eukprot:9044349-Ditylum_brightwellii.AAC.1